MNNDRLTTTLYDLATFWAERGVAAWLVGGAVRDLLCGKMPLDLDLAVAGDGFELARVYANVHQAAFVPLDAERATGRIVLPGSPPLTIDVAGLRGSTIEADLRLRDLTINALALPLTEALANAFLVANPGDAAHAASASLLTPPSTPQPLLGVPPLLQGVQGQTENISDRRLERHQDGSDSPRGSPAPAAVQGRTAHASARRFRRHQHGPAAHLSSPAPSSGSGGQGVRASSASQRRTPMRSPNVLSALKLAVGRPEGQGGRVKRLKADQHQFLLTTQRAKGKGQKAKGKSLKADQHQFLLTTLIDPTNGLADLQAGRLRSCGPTSLLDDPLRVVRVARFAAQLGWQPVPELVAQMKAAAGNLGVVAHERIRDELLRLLDAPASAPALRLLDQTGALTGIFPELAAARDCAQPRVHFLPVLAHSLETVAALDWLTTVITVGDASRLPAEALPVAVQRYPDLATEIPYASQLASLLNERRAGGHRRVTLLKLAALLHDNAKPQTRVNHPDGSVTFYGHQEQGAEIALNIARRLRLARPDAALVSLIVHEHMRPGQLRTSGPPTPRALARLFRDFGDATPEVLLHELADHLASRGPHTDPVGWEAHLAWFGAILARYYRPIEERQPLWLTGHDLINELGLSPGPQLGMLLREVAEAQAADEITSRDEALALVRRLINP